MKKMFLILAMICLQAMAFDPRGLWLTPDGSAKIQIYNQNGKLYGKIVWLKEPNNAQGKAKTDLNNPDVSHHNQPIVGLLVLRDLKNSDTDEYSDGTIYDPKNGKSYACKMTQPDANTLDLRGFVGISLMGRSQTWKRTN